MNGRYFSQQRLQAYIFDGSERFRKTNEKKAALEDDDGEEDENEDEGKRLEQFGSWLEADGKA